MCEVFDARKLKSHKVMVFFNSIWNFKTWKIWDPCKTLYAKHNGSGSWESLFPAVQVCIPQLMLCSVCHRTILLQSSLQWCLPSVLAAFFCPCLIFLLLLQPIIDTFLLLWKPLSISSDSTVQIKEVPKQGRRNVFLILLLSLKPAFLLQMLSAAPYSAIHIVLWELIPSQYVSGE